MRSTIIILSMAVLLFFPGYLFAQGEDHAQHKGSMKGSMKGLMKEHHDEEESGHHGGGDHLDAHGNQGSHEDDHEKSSSDEDFWEDDIKQYESVHDHSSPHGGQVGMSGSLHIEFVVREEGEYRIHVTDYERNSIDISKATGFLVIDPESPGPEKLVLSVDKILKEFLWAKGKPRKQGETITASIEVEIPGQERIIQSFYIKIKHSSDEHETGHEEERDDHHAH